MLSIPGFTIENMLYTGKRFAVYQAIRNSDQKNFILKSCLSEHPSAQDLGILQHEYQILKQLHSPEIIQAHDLIKHQHRLILVLEDMEGMSLRQYMDGKLLEITDFFKVALKIVKALDDLHQYHIIHKDINPDNIIVDSKLKLIKLTDFSIASQLSQETHSSLQIHNLEGTLNYIAPEQTGRMNRPLDYRADFYSLGITFYEMLTGRVPFKGNDPLELLHCHLAKEPEPIHQVNENIPLILGDIIHKLLAKAAENRYISASGLYKDLQECQSQWTKTKKIETFILCQEDRPSHLIISSKLYGRESQVVQLLDAFNRISEGSREVLFITGASGIGKSSLVKEIYPSITRQRSYFVSGKFDLLNRTTPYSAFIEAFQELVKLLLAEPEQRLQQLREDLLNAVGNNGQVIIEVIPQVSLILGDQPPVAVLPPRESQNRFMLTFQNFVRVLAQPSHPLVVFLDDLQWADSASLQLLDLILQDPESGHLLILAAYRSNSMPVDNPVIRLQKTLEKAKVTCGHLLLSALSEPDIQNLLYDTLGCLKEETAELTHILFSKTHGNPFFLNQLLKKLYQDNILTYSNQKKRWVWDSKRISEEELTDNVVDLLSTRIRQLPVETQDILKLAACIGHNFDLHTLSVINEKPAFQTAQAIWEAVQAELLHPIGEGYRLVESLKDHTDQAHQAKEIQYRFSHDKIQKTAYQLIEDSQRIHIHLKIGRLLKGKDSLNIQDKSLFEIVGHFNKSLSLITNPQEKLQIAEGNLWAGIRAKSATAYVIANEYFICGLQLLPENSWADHYDLTFSLHRERAECQYQTVNYEEAQEYFEMLLKKARVFKDMMEIYKLQIIMLNTLNQPSKALEVGIKALEHLNIILPLNPSKFSILKMVVKVRLKVGFRHVRDIELAPATDVKITYLNEICQHLFTSAYTYDQHFFALLILTLIDYGLTYGYTPALSYTCYCYGYILMHILGFHKEGLEYIALGEKLSRPDSSPNVLTREHAVLALLIDNWRAPLINSYENASKTHRYAIEGGDLIYANIGSILEVTNLYRMRKPLSEYSKAAQAALAFQERFNLRQMRLSLKLGLELSQTLQTSTARAPQGILPILYEKIPDLKNLANREDKTEVSSLYNILIKFCYHLGTPEEAVEIAKMQPRFAQFTSGSGQNAEAIFFSALAFSTIYHKSTAQEQRDYRRRIKAAHQNFIEWAQWYPLNFLAYERLLAAEIARIDHNLIDAMELYDQAIKAAEDGECLYLPAIANECAGRFYLQMNKNFIAKSYIQNAHYGYEQWGAQACIKNLENEFPEWFYGLSSHHGTIMGSSQNHMTSNHSDSDSLDMVALLKSTQAIASEIRLDKLMEKLLEVLLQSSGAQRAVLLLKEKGSWRIKAEGKAGSDQPPEILDISLADYANLPSTLINYTQRTREKILIHHEKDLEPYKGEDTYLQNANPQSLLVLPLIHQGEIASILYLENRSTAYAFPAPHLYTIELLASQAAISLTNANLYHQATHDHLTKLPNRNLLYQMFAHASSRAKRYKKNVAILFLDLDGFKKINDTLGHEIGDKVLQYFSDQLTQILRTEDLAVRLGGDEFVIMLEDIVEPVQAAFVAERILKQINKVVSIGGNDIRFGTSIGISLYPNDSTEIQDLLKQADAALYRVKESGRGHYKFYHDHPSA